MKGHLIKEIVPGSIAEEMEIEPGDTLLSINNMEIKDVFDYHYCVNDDYLTVLIEKPDGEQWELEIEKDYEDDLGIEFEQGLMDEYRSCRNKCIFCFIDQMPPNMRETLYFKDDDARLSFLQGNYITMTNMSEDDLDRVLLYKLSPVNISVHTTNTALRCKMLNNRFAGDILDKIRRLYEGHIEMNSQIVLCKGYNDRGELTRTVEDLAAFLPYMKSLSVVPVGLTKYRENLAPLDPFTKDEAREVIHQIELLQERYLSEHGTRFVFASDEWYLTAELPVPSENFYEGYPQLENGVGVIRSLTEEVSRYLESLPGDDRHRCVSMATGLLAGPVMRELVGLVNRKYPNVTVHVYPVENQFFGTMITVAGLLTGQDLDKQLRDKELGDKLLLPSVMFRSGEDVFLDDMTREELENALQTPVRIVQSDGISFVSGIIGDKFETKAVSNI
ncbi:DUF512 domain-containing protein [Anaerolentibacter hominis]|uniref:DUF512 domain-containing protein n=1 Tax=Anaerolentibacter hominis TaxID=3079009 RepID=UPI0031B825BB